MKKIVTCLLLYAGVLATVSAFDEDGERRPREGERGEARQERDGDERRERGERGPRDGEGERRGPRDSDRPEGRGPRDGDRPPMMGGPVLSALDTNHNGILESEEIDRAIVILRRMDRNKDGKLTGEEFGRRGDGDRPMREGDPRTRGGDPRQGGNLPGPEQMMERFKQADANEDGKLSREEAPERMKQNFERVDRNEDGFVDKSEFETLIRNMRRGGGRPSRDGEGRGPREGGDREGERRRPEAE